MKPTVESALQSIARRAEVDAPLPPTYRLAWVRAEYARSRRLATRRRRVQALIPAAAAAIAALVLVIWKGAWMHDIGLSQLGAVAASALNLFSGAPLAAVAALALVVFVLADGVSILE